MPYRIREAHESDAQAVAALHVQTFTESHRNGRPGGPSYELRERQWRGTLSSNDELRFCFVAQDDAGRLVGFASGACHDGGVSGYAGELDKIYVLRKHQRQSLGRLLLCSVARRFLARGVTSMLLFGDAANPSNAFYEALGAERLYASTGEFHGGYGWPDLHEPSWQVQRRVIIAVVY
jgi:GNAT superfamily N-acetyltransferase